MTRSAALPIRRTRGLPAVFVMAAVAGVAQSFGRFAFGIVLPAITQDLDLTNTVAGFLGTLNVGAYLVGTLGVAWATGRFKLLPVMRVGFVVSIAGLVLSAAAPGVVVLGLAMFCSGFGGALVWIPAPVMATAALPPEKRSMGVALLGTGMGGGVVFASQLSGWVRSSMGDSDWRVVYIVLAAIGAGVYLLALALIGHEQDRPTGGGGIGGVTALKRMPGWLPLTAAYTSFGFLYLLVMAYLPKKLEDDNGWTSSRAALSFTLVGLAIAFGGPLFITLSDRIGPRRALTIAFSGWIVVVLAILPGWAPVALPGSFVIGLMFAGIPTMITLYVVKNTSLDDYGPAFSAATLAFGVAQMIGPQVGGALADLTGSFTTTFLLSAAFALTGVVFSLQLPRPKQDPKAS